MKKGFLWKNGSLPQTERWWILFAEYEHHVETGQYSKKIGLVLLFLPYSLVRF